MEKHTDRILWSVLILAIGISLFVSFTPVSKNIISNVQDQLCFTGASQVSDFDVSPKIVVKHDQLQEADIVGDKTQLSELTKSYNLQTPGVNVTLWPKTDASSVYRLVSNHESGQMYLSISADYFVTNLVSLNDDLSYRFNNQWHSLVAEIALEDDDGTIHYYQAVRYFNESDLNKSFNGTIHNQWKLPKAFNNEKISRITMYVANLKADEIVLDNFKLGVWNGSIKDVTN